MTASAMRPSQTLRARTVAFWAATCLCVIMPQWARGAEIAPLSYAETVAATSRARFAETTLAVGVVVDRDGARIVSSRRKQQPYLRSVEVPPRRAYSRGEPVQIEVVLRGPDGLRHTRRISAGPLCFDHGPGADPHVAGDTIQLHQDGFVVELPEIAGFDELEVAYHELYRGEPLRRALGIHSIADARAEKAGEQFLAGETADVLWPEEFGDPDTFRVFGDPASGADRVNIVIVPDGYRYADKALMESHAAEMVEYFRAARPIGAHDALINYTLVYAYSVEAGTDQCDCDVTHNTAMGTRFPASNGECGHSDNRCLYYGSNCDASGIVNILEAELRAPYHDETIVMVNTSRYGGCGGSRAVYSAGNADATDIAVHEVGHSLFGLADEYSYNAGCDSYGGEINTSIDSVNGAWPEWIDDLGAPREGAQYWRSCLYRPVANCEMRSLFQPFCPVCAQHMSLVLYGHPRVSPSAPIASATPSSPLVMDIDESIEFSVTTRLSQGLGVTHSVRWLLKGPGDSSPVTMASGDESFTHLFSAPGDYVVTCEVIADTNFVKSEKTGANRGVAQWNVEIFDPLCADGDGDGHGACADCDDSNPMVWSEPQEPTGLAFDTGTATLSWNPPDAGAAPGAIRYGVVRANLAGDRSDAVCLALDPATNYSDSDFPPPGSVYHYLVLAINPCGESSLGVDSAGSQRVGHPCLNNP